MPEANRTKGLLKRAQSAMKKERWRDAIKLLKANSSIVEENWELLWNLGWCYFKLQRMDKAQKHLTAATRLSPNRHSCKFGMGVIYLERKQYKKAESILSEALEIKDNHVTRICLALAFLAQGKVEQAERLHLDGIKLKPKENRRYESYAAFLSDVGREAEAKRMSRKASELRRIN